MHKSAFVNIVGNPNVGKSTLMNVLVGERMSIITNKPQTTRHRIIGIVNDEDFQIVFSDTPGLIYDPSYKMQNSMNRFAFSTIEDADIMMLVIDPLENSEVREDFIIKMSQLSIPKLLVINKIDIASEEQLDETLNFWNEKITFSEIHLISALQKTNTEKLMNSIIDLLPEGPAYYPKDQLTDKPERFFVSEIIREKILQLYHQEIPYSTEVVVTNFEVGDKKGKKLIKILAEIYVARQTQKSIIIGKQGRAIKELGIQARKSIEEFLESQVYLELYVRVKENWRDDERLLKNFGYQ